LFCVVQIAVPATSWSPIQRNSTGCLCLSVCGYVCNCVCVCVSMCDIETLKLWGPRSDIVCYTTEEEEEEAEIFVLALIWRGFKCNSLFSPSPVFCYSLYFVYLLSLCTCDVFVVGNDVVDSWRI